MDFLIENNALIKTISFFMVVIIVVFVNALAAFHFAKKSKRSNKVSKF